MSSSFNRIKKNIIEAMQSTNNQGTSAYDSVAEVRRVEGDTAWVHIAGGVDETPVKLTVAAKAGDTVQVRVGGGRAWITGNATAPPTDDTAANKAKTTAVTAQRSADDAQATADDNSVKIEKLEDELNLQVKNSDDQFSQINVRIGEISSTVQESGESVSTLEQTANRFEARVSSIEYDMDVYMSFSSDGLVLGRSDSDYKLRLTNSGIDFLFDDDAIGTITSVAGDPDYGGGDVTVIRGIGAGLILAHDSYNTGKDYFEIDGRLCFPPNRWKQDADGRGYPIIPITLLYSTTTGTIVENHSLPTKAWVTTNAAMQGSERGNIPTFYNVYLQELADDRNNSYTPNVFVSTTGALHTTTKSSRRWKHDITNFENVFDYRDLYKLPVRSFIYNLDKVSEDDPRYGVETPGFVAEEVFDTIPIAADMSEDKTQVDNWNDRIMIPYMVKAIQEQHKEIMKLETKVSNLETRLAELEAKLK